LFLYAGILAAGFFGVKYGLTNVSGGIDENALEFEKQSGSDRSETIVVSVDTDQDLGKLDMLKSNALRQKQSENLCKIRVLRDVAPKNAEKIITVYRQSGSDSLVSKMIFAVYLRIKNTGIVPESWDQCEKNAESFSNADATLNENSLLQSNDYPNVFSWMNGEEWKSIEQAVMKDKEKIYSAAQSAGIEPRIIVASLIVEQLRLFYTQRELFETIFKPLKILGNATKISLGVMGIKESTAIDIEHHLKDSSSPYYLGPSYEHMLDFQSGADTERERFLRLANEHDHYFSYLYGALYLRQFLEQWQREGYDIRYRIEILSTLFNVGFPQSRPKSDPKVGGSEILVESKKYSFGSLAYEFYYSGVLAEEFPYEV
jgi:hypothetical protein